MKDLLIVVPYRNREEHLKGFLKNSPDYFSKQNLTYDLLICELDQRGDWNAGLCVNSLINFISSSRQYKWLYIHHVDVWPIEGKWILPSDEKQAYFNLGDYGSCLLTLKAFLEVGGYSNSFWGWGWEDNELYSKLRQKGYQLLDGSQHYPVKYNTTFQSHERKFNGRNYANGIKQLMILPEEKRNNITHFIDHGIVKDFQCLSSNVFKQIICPLRKSPNEFENNKVVIGYLKGITKFEDVVEYVKSLGMYASYEFDNVLILADDNPPEQLTNELESFGVKWIHRKQERKDLFFDRYLAYKDFLENNPQYIYALHTDVTDVIFQQNPFSYLDLHKVTLTNEGIQIKDEIWNYNMCKGLFGASVDLFANNFVICGGIIGAPREEFIKLCNLIIKEFDQLVIGAPVARGSDQPIINKLIWQDKIFNHKISIKNINDNFAINLHCPINYPSIFSNISILSNKVINKETAARYAIVHQYNRNSALSNNIKKHYNEFYFPIS